MIDHAANQTLADSGLPVARTLLSNSSGHGIVVPPDTILKILPISFLDLQTIYREEIASL